MKKFETIVNEKKLNATEKRSLMASIQACTDFGDDASNYIKKFKIYDSVLFTYCRVLRYMGIPFISFRETDRYKFMLELSIQQTWKKGLGNILLATKFYNTSNAEIFKGRINNDPFVEAMKLLFANHDYKQIISLIFTGFPDIKFVSLYNNGTTAIIAGYYKKNNKFSLFRVLFSLNGMLLFINESDLKRAEIGVSCQIKSSLLNLANKEAKPVSPVDNEDFLMPDSSDGLFDYAKMRNFEEF